MPRWWRRRQASYPYVSGSTGNSSARGCHGLPLLPLPSATEPAGPRLRVAANVTGHVVLPSNSYEDMMRTLVGPRA